MTDSYRIVGLAGRGAVATAAGDGDTYEPFLADLALWSADGAEPDLPALARVAAEALVLPYSSLRERAEAVAAAVRSSGAISAVEVTLHQPEASLGVPVLDVELTIRRPVKERSASVPIPVVAAAAAAPVVAPASAAVEAAAPVVEAPAPVATPAVVAAPAVAVEPEPQPAPVVAAQPVVRPAPAFDDLVLAVPDLDPHVGAAPALAAAAPVVPAPAWLPVGGAHDDVSPRPAAPATPEHHPEAEPVIESEHVAHAEPVVAPVVVPEIVEPEVVAEQDVEPVGAHDVEPELEPVAEPAPDAVEEDEDAYSPTVRTAAPAAIRRPSAEAPLPALLVISATGEKAQAELAGTVHALGAAAGIDLGAVSPLARTTKPSGDLHTAVLRITTTLPPAELAAAASSAVAHRPAVTAEVLAIEGLVGEIDGVELPLPGAASSASVLVPWSHLEPSAVLPGLGGGPVVVLAETAPDREDVRWLALDWLEA